MNDTSPQTGTGQGVCEGIQVLELGAGSVGASLAGMLFADYGAHVVKVEPPEGDRFRDEHPAAFQVWNRGKESLVADLRTDQGREEVRRLALSADVVIEGFGIGIAEDWDLAYPNLKEGNPGLIYCSVKGFGSKGPYARLKGYEGLVCAKAGAYAMGPWGFREGPIFFSAPLAGIGAGHLAFSGSLGALTARETTGLGQHVEATMFQGIVPLDYVGVAERSYVPRDSADASGAAPEQTRNVVAAHRYGLYVPTQDGRWVIFTQILPHQAHALSRAVGIEHTLDDPRFAQQPRFGSAEDAQEWEDLIWDALSKQPYAHWEKAFLAEPHIAFELVRRSEEGLDHPQIRHNGEAVTIVDPDIGEIAQLGPIVRFADTPARVETPAPGLGQHDREWQPRQELQAHGPLPRHALEGVTIVELGYFYAMPYGVTMAAALGARVIKLEGPGGDPMRMFVATPETGAAKVLEGKESLAIDLQTPEGQQIARDVIVQADVFINGFRSGVADRLGLDRETLQKLNPRLSYIHAAGYGADGPFAARPIYAQVAQAVAGSIGRYGGPWLSADLAKDLTPAEAQVVVLPRLRGPIDGDSNAALAVLSSLLLAVYHQRRTGQGQYAETSMIGGNACAYSDDFVRYAGKPPLPVPDDDNRGLSALYRLYRCESSWVFLAVLSEGEWKSLVSALDSPEVLTAAEYATPADRQDNDADLVAALATIFATRHASEWEELLSKHDVGCAQAAETSQSEVTCTDESLRKGDLVLEVEHPLFGNVIRAGLPVFFSDTPGRAEPGCLVGQHTDAVLREIGRSADEIDDLKARGIVFDHRSADHAPL